MIFELIAAAAAGVFAAAAAYEAVAIVRERRRGARGRLPAPPTRIHHDQLYAVAGLAMNRLPQTWSHSIARTFGNGLSAKLAAAGMGGVDPPSFIGAEFVLAVIGFLAGKLAVGPGALGFGAGIALAFGAWWWPRFQLETNVAKRRLDFARLLPDFVDMLAIGVEAGLSLDRGIRLYCERFDNTLSRAFSSAMMEIELGKPRRSSFRELAEKNQNDDLGWFITSVLQAEKLGSPLALALREQAGAGRERQSELIKELTATAPIKMLFPIAGLILPALMIMIMGPAFLQFMR